MRTCAPGGRTSDHAAVELHGHAVLQIEGFDRPARRGIERQHRAERGRARRALLDREGAADRIVTVRRVLLEPDPDRRLRLRGRPARHAEHEQQYQREEVTHAPWYTEARPPACLLDDERRQHRAMVARHDAVRVARVDRPATTSPSGSPTPSSRRCSRCGRSWSRRCSRRRRWPCRWRPRPPTSRCRVVELRDRRLVGPRVHVAGDDAILRLRAPPTSSLRSPASAAAAGRRDRGACRSG